jgi:putative DNA primase/helicase
MENLLKTISRTGEHSNSESNLCIEPTFPSNIIKPSFDELQKPETFKNHLKLLVKKDSLTQHDKILNKLIDQFKPLDFQSLAFPQAKKLRIQYEDPNSGGEQKKEIFNELTKLKVNNKHYLVLSIKNVREVAENNRWGICKNQDFVYLYNGAYWSYVEKETFQKFLGESAERMGVGVFNAQYFQFREQLLKQFLATEYLPSPTPPIDVVYINLINGTFEINSNGTKLRQFRQADFLTYQLPFKYDLEAEAPLFHSYLNKVLPDKERQMVLAEYLGFLFIKHGSNVLKEEKALVLYGTGANGKSVFFEVVSALLGSDNISSYSLQSLTDANGYSRAMIANKLVNYASEINGNLEASIFKQLVSGEPVEARLPYGNPMQIKHYAKLIFNCNELPKDVEHTNAYFRRFLIIPFDVTIPEKEQDKQLHTKIINTELSGVFNWVLEGLSRLLKQKHFSDCGASIQAIERYRTESDSVKLFIEENHYQSNISEFKLVKELNTEYRAFCQEDGFKPVQKMNFIKRLKAIGIVIERKNIGNVVFVSKEVEPFI